MMPVHAKKCNHPLGAWMPRVADTSIQKTRNSKINSPRIETPFSRASLFACVILLYIKEHVCASFNLPRLVPAQTPDQILRWKAMGSARIFFGVTSKQQAVCKGE